jgi:hypothetical protein
VIVEQRKAIRRKHLKGALIVVGNGRSSVGCTVRDMTEDGAMLLVGSSVGLPSTFTLQFNDGSPTRGCSVVWKKLAMLGVRFR